MRCRSGRRRLRGSRAGRRARSPRPPGSRMPSTTTVARHHVLGHAGRRSCRAPAPSRACSFRRSSSRRGRRSRLTWAVAGRPRSHACRPGPSTRTWCGRAASCRRWLSDRDGLVAGRPTTASATARPPSRHRGCSPAVYARRLGLPDGRVVGARKDRDRAELRGHCDPLVGLGHHRRLACDRVAQHREAVARADGEGVEAIEIIETALERLLEGRAFPRAARSGIRRRPRCRCRSAKWIPSRRASLPQPVVIRQRTVVDQAEVESGGERMRVVGA